LYLRIESHEGLNIQSIFWRQKLGLTYTYKIHIWPSNYSRIWNGKYEFCAKKPDLGLMWS